MNVRTPELRRRVPHPIFRKLRVFAIDPGMTGRFETAVLNEMTLAIPWERLERGVLEATATAPVDWGRFPGRAETADDWLDVHIDF